MAHRSATGSTRAATALRLLTIVAVVFAAGLPAVGSPDPAAARFDGTVDFTADSVLDGRFFPDGSGGWRGLLYGASPGAATAYTTVHQATIDSSGTLTGTRELFRNTEAEQGWVYAYDVAPDGSVVFTARDGSDNSTFLHAYGPDGSSLFAPVAVADPYVVAQAGWLRDGRIWTAARIQDKTAPYVQRPKVVVFDRGGHPAADFTLDGDLGITTTASVVFYTGVDGVLVYADNTIREVDPDTKVVLRQAPADYFDVLLPRGDLGYFRVVRDYNGPDQFQVLDRDFALVGSPRTYGEAPYTFVRAAVGAAGDAAVAWIMPGTPSTVHVQNYDRNGTEIGDEVTRAASPANYDGSVLGPSFVSVGDTGQSLAGWFHGATGSGYDGHLFDSSVDAVTATFEVKRTHEAERGNYDGQGTGYFELITFDATASTGRAGDPIDTYEWNLTSDPPGAPTPPRAALSTDAAPEFRFRLPSGQRRAWTVELKVTTTSGQTATFRRTVKIAGPAASGWARVNEPPAPRDAGGVVPKTGYTESFRVRYSSVHDLGPVAAAGTEAVWSDPNAADLVTRTGTTADVALPAYRPPGGKDLTAWTPDDTDGAHLDSTWTWTPRKSGVYKLTMTTTYVDPSDPEYRRAAAVRWEAQFNGARVEGEPQAGFGDAANPGSIGVASPSPIGLEFDNTGYGYADVALTVPTLSGYDLDLEADSFVLAPGVQTTKNLTVTTNRAGAVTIPVHVKVTDSVTGAVTGDYDFSVQVNVVAGFEWAVPDNLERPGDDGVPPDLPDTSGETSDVDRDSFPVDVTLTDAEDCTGTIEWAVTRIATDDDGVETRSLLPGTEPSSRDECTFRFDLPDEAVYEFDVSLDGRQVALGQLEINDVLWVVLGDSIASGEGNPDLAMDSPGGPRWVDAACRRSLRSGAAAAAYDHEEASTKSSVTLVDLACSGASITKGVLGPQEASEVLVSESRPAQLDVLDALIGDREPDVTVLQVGGNDLLFGPVLAFCAAEGDASTSCADLGFSEDTDVEVAGITFLNNMAYPRRLDPYAGLMCETGPRASARAVRTFPLPAALSEGNDYSNSNPDQGTGWDVTLNAVDMDFSRRTPWFVAEPYGPRPTGSENYTSTEVRSVDCFNPVTLGTADGFSMGVDAPLPTNHYGYYKREGGGLLSAPQMAAANLDVVIARPQSLKDRMEKMVAGLGGRYDQVADRLEAIGVPAESVLAVEYPDPLHGDDGQACPRVLGPPDLGRDELKAVGLLANEANWAEAKMLGPLNGQFEQAAARHDWTFVGGVARAFRTHGYCATGSYITSLGDSLSRQGTWSGTMHPDAEGHEVIASSITAAVDGIVDDPSRYGAVDPTLAGQLERAAKAGSTAIFLRTGARPFAAPGKAGGGAAGVRAAGNPGFEVGDWVQIGTGNLTVDLEGERLVSPPEVREVTRVTPGGIEVAPALGSAHLAGEKVTLVPDRSLVADPYIAVGPTGPTGPTRPATPVAPPATPTTPAGGGALAWTGTHPAPLVLTGLALCLAGLVLGSRRRRAAARAHLRRTPPPTA